MEFAILIPVLFALAFGIIDFGRALYTSHFVSEAAREATRWASVRGNACSGLSGCGAGQFEVNAYVASIVPMGIDPSKLNVTATWVAPPNNLAICQAVSTVPVVRYTFESITSSNLFCLSYRPRVIG